MLFRELDMSLKLFLDRLLRFQDVVEIYQTILPRLFSSPTFEIRVSPVTLITVFPKGPAFELGFILRFTTKFSA
jgi:hypothetical protein